MIRIAPALLAAAWLAATGPGLAEDKTDVPDRKSEYVRRVTHSEGFMPWQDRDASDEETKVREEIEARKDRMLAARVPVRHPVMLTPEDIFGLRGLRAHDGPPPTWQAVWSQADRAYRLWSLCQVDRVEASNGPGQEQRNQMGRRVRYVDAVREGDELSSVFVAVHEPSGPAGKWTVHSASRLETPPAAGAEAVAVKIASAWGEYLILSDFAHRAEIDGVQFAGSFGLLCRTPAGEKWLFAVGASTLQQGAFGFSGGSAWWSGEVDGTTETAIGTSTEKPGDWPSIPENCENHVLANDGAYDTGFPVEEVEEHSITVRRFPLPKLTSFQLPAVRYVSEDGE